MFPRLALVITTALMPDHRIIPTAWLTPTSGNGRSATSLYWNKGNHSFKFGVDAVHNYDLMNNTYKSNGYFSYNWVGNMFNDILNVKHGVTPSVANPVGCDVNASQKWQRRYWHLSLLLLLRSGIWKPRLHHLHYGHRRIRPGQLEVLAAPDL